MSELYDAHVYVIAKVIDGRALPPSKIGIATDPYKRLSTFRTSCPFPIDVIGSFNLHQRSFAADLEQFFHSLHKDTRLHGEWFDIHPLDALAVVAVLLKAKIENAHAKSPNMEAWEGINLNDYFEKIGVTQVLELHAKLDGRHREPPVASPPISEEQKGTNDD